MLSNPSVTVQNLNFIDGKTAGETSKRQGPYVQFTAEEKVKIVKRTAEFGVATAFCHFQTKKTFVECELKDSSVWTWRTEDLNERGKKKCSGEEININELPDEKWGRKLMLGEELDKQAQSYLLDLHCNAAVFNS